MLLGAAAVVLLGGPAAAADGSCQSMIRSFDKASFERQGAAGMDVKRFTEAKRHRDAGAAELAKGREQACIARLKQAHDRLTAEVEEKA